jgi:uncharacterized membrane protein (DUF4010 family)
MDLLLIKLLTAGAVGLILGIERGWSAKALADTEQVAGIRTFTLAGLAGGLCSLLPGNGYLLALVVGAVALLLAATHFINHAGTKDAGLTTELALLVTPLLGALATRNPLEATAAAALAAALLGFKQELHGVLDRLGRNELLASLQLLVVAVVILPLLPDRAMGPWDSINPRTIGWLVLLLLSVSYVGYFAVRIIGPGRGLLLTALLGGFTSSTAVTLAYARMSRTNPEASPLLSGGIALACAMMALRVALVVSAIQPALIPAIRLPLVALGAIPLAYAFAVARPRSGAHAGQAVMLDNPFAIGAAMVMAAGITGLTVAIRAAEAWLGTAGTYTVAALSGILDVDAISVAMAESTARGGPTLSTTVAANGILIAVAVNTLAKAIMAAATGTPAVGVRCGLLLTLAALGAGAAALLG